MPLTVDILMILNVHYNDVRLIVVEQQFHFIDNEPKMLDLYNTMLMCTEQRVHVFGLQLPTD